MILETNEIAEVYVWETPKHIDKRGSLFKVYPVESTLEMPFKFDTIEHFFTNSNHNVFRGFHLQIHPHASNKIVTFVNGLTDVFLLDTRLESETYGLIKTIVKKDTARVLSIYIPIGVALGYLTRSENVIVSYRMDKKYCQFCDAGVMPEFTDLNMSEKLLGTIRSERDLVLPKLGSLPKISKCAIEL